MFPFPISISLFAFQFAVPTEMGILLKEHFNRWYSLKAYYVSVTLLDLPISVIKMEMKKKISPNYQLWFLMAYFVLFSPSFRLHFISFHSNLESKMLNGKQLIGCGVFTVLIYTITSQPFELFRFGMFFAISFLVTVVGQSIGLMVGAWFDVVVSIL